MCRFATANARSVLPHMQVTVYARCICSLNRIQPVIQRRFQQSRFYSAPPALKFMQAIEETDGLPDIERGYLSFRGGSGAGKVAVLISMLLMNTTCRQTLKKQMTGNNMESS